MPSPLRQDAVAAGRLQVVAEALGVRSFDLLHVGLAVALGATAVMLRSRYRALKKVSGRS